MPLQGDQLSRMTIRGFKSIKNCDISFGKINVLIGSNGAGKSNFSTVSKQLVALRSSASDNRLLRLYQNGSKSPENQGFPGFYYI